MSNNYSFFSTDPIVEGLPFTNTPYLFLLIPICYLLIVLKYLPAYMKDRPAYNLKGIIQIYNITQIIFNGYLICSGAKGVLKKDYFAMRLEPHEYVLGYAYLLLKIYDLLETVFFLLRKKQKQVSFLHVYHHVMVLVVFYFEFRANPGKIQGGKSLATICSTNSSGHNMIYGLVNTTVHALMYCYYFFAAYDSKIKWLYKWKKFITQVQLLQFVIFIIHYGWPLYYGHCCISPAQCLLNSIQACVMLVLFGNFYVKAYMKKTK